MHNHIANNADFIESIILTLILSGCVGGNRCFASRMMLSKVSFNFSFVPKESGSLVTCSIKVDKCNSVSYTSTTQHIINSLYAK